MRKQDLIHIHCLLAEFKEEYDRRTERATHLEDYDQLEVLPISLYRPKYEHEEAVLVLAAELSAAIEEDEMTPDTVQPNGSTV
jgi:hypothetical protein